MGSLLQLLSKIFNSILIPAKPMALLFRRFFQQIYCLSPVEIGAGREDSIYKTHWRCIGSAKGWRIHRSNEGLVRKSGDGGDQGVGNSNAIRSIGFCLLQAFYRLPEAASKTDGDYQVALSCGPAQMRRFSRGNCRNRWQAQEHQVVM